MLDFFFRFLHNTAIMQRETLKDDKDLLYKSDFFYSDLLSLLLLIFSVICVTDSVSCVSLGLNANLCHSDPISFLQLELSVGCVTRTHCLRKDLKGNNVRSLIIACFFAPKG